MRKRNLLFNTAKKSNNPMDWEKYKCVRNMVVAMLRRNKRQYFYNLRFATNKDFWKAIKVINKQDSSIPTLRDGDTSVTSNVAKAELLNSFFYKCFCHSSLPLSNPRSRKLPCLHTLHRGAGTGNVVLLGDFKIHWPRLSVCLHASTNCSVNHTMPYQTL